MLLANIFPGYRRHLDELYESGNRDNIFNRGGVISPSKLLAKNIALGLRAHLVALQKLELVTYARMRVYCPQLRGLNVNPWTARVVTYEDKNTSDKFMLWGMMRQSRYYACLMMVASKYAVQSEGRRESRKLQEARSIFNQISHTCGVLIKEAPVTVRVGQTCLSKFLKWDGGQTMVNIILPDSPDLQAVCTQCADDIHELVLEVAHQ